MAAKSKKKLIVIALVTLLAIGVGVGVTLYIIEQGKDPVPTPFDVERIEGGRYASQNPELDPDELTEEQRIMIQQLEAIGYMTGVKKADDKGGVVVHDAARIYPGYGVYLPGHDRVAILMSLEGEALHRPLLRGEPSMTSITSPSETSSGGLRR